MKSVKIQETAVALVVQLRELLQNLTKWTCNSGPVLETITQSDRAKEVKDLDVCSAVIAVERALGPHGVRWYLEAGEFVFKIQA